MVLTEFEDQEASLKQKHGIIKALQRKIGELGGTVDGSESVRME